MPGGIQTVADCSHHVVELPRGIGTVSVRRRITLCEHKVPVTALAQQVGLFDEGTVAACRNHCIAMDAVLRGAFSRQIDRGKIIAIGLWLRTFVHGNAAHAVDR